jgi:hypothetical protein
VPAEKFSAISAPLATGKRSMTFCNWRMANAGMIWCFLAGRNTILAAPFAQTI